MGRDSRSTGAGEAKEALGSLSRGRSDDDDQVAWQVAGAAPITSTDFRSDLIYARSERPSPPSSPMSEFALGLNCRLSSQEGGQLGIWVTPRVLSDKCRDYFSSLAQLLSQC
jgi:hypothetical protein